MANSKAYKVVLTNGTERIVEANTVEEANGRLKFTGDVEGHAADYSRNGDLVASFLSEDVAEYGVVPVAQEEKTGANVYRVTFTSGETEDVRADRLLYSRGTDKCPGQFTLVTTLRNAESRTEYLVGEDRVLTVKRVTDPDSVAVPAQGDAADAVASA